MSVRCLLALYTISALLDRASVGDALKNSLKRLHCLVFRGIVHCRAVSTPVCHSGCELRIVDRKGSVCSRVSKYQNLLAAL